MEIIKAPHNACEFPADSKERWASCDPCMQRLGRVQTMEEFCSELGVPAAFLEMGAMTNSVQHRIRMSTEAAVLRVVLPTMTEGVIREEVPFREMRRKAWSFLEKDLSTRLVTAGSMRSNPANVGRWHILLDLLLPCPT